MKDRKHYIAGEVRTGRKITKVDLDLSASRRFLTTNMDLPNMSPIKKPSRLQLEEKELGYLLINFILEFLFMPLCTPSLTAECR